MLTILLTCLFACQQAAAHASLLGTQRSKLRGVGSAHTFATSRRALLGTTRALLNTTGGAAALGCTPSTEPDFTCMTTQLHGAMTIFYNGYKAGDTGATFGLAIPSTTGWVGLGFPTASAPTTMVGSTAVIVTTSAGSSGIGVYSLNGESVGSVQLASSGGRRLAASVFSINDTAVERAGGRTYAKFTRPFDDVFTAGAAQKPYIAAYGDTEALSMHKSNGAFKLALSASVAATSGSTSADLHVYYDIHAWFMVIAWGVLVPLGVMMALAMRHYGNISESIGPIWFFGHRVCNVSAVLLSTVGFAVAVAKFEAGNDYLHKALGYVICIIAWLQPFIALLRPHLPLAGEKKSMQRVGWECLHKGLGFSALALGIANIFTGISLRYEVEGAPTDGHKNLWRVLFGIWIAVWAVLGLVCYGFGRVLRNKRDKEQTQSSADQSKAEAEGR